MHGERVAGHLRACRRARGAGVAWWPERCGGRAEELRPLARIDADPVCFRYACFLGAVGGWAGAGRREFSSLPPGSHCSLCRAQVALCRAEAAPSIRLVDARGVASRAGLVQVLVDGSTYGSVCGMNSAAADVACRQLGVPTLPIHALLARICRPCAWAQGSTLVLWPPRRVADTAPPTFVAPLEHQWPCRISRARVAS